MKQKNFCIAVLFLLCCFSLSSCFIDRWVSEALRGEDPVSEQIHDDTGDSIALLNYAFNGDNQEQEEVFTSYTPEEGSGYEVVSIDQNITNLSYMDGNTPSSGNVKALVLPVDFIDYPAKKIENVEFHNEWESVSSFYYQSSYGKLNLTFDVMDWYTCKQKSTYYENLMGTKYSGEVPGVSAIIDEVLKYYRTRIDFSQYDSNKDKVIDALYIIYSHDIDYSTGDFWWAYQYYTFENISYSGYQSYPYVFAAYDFLFEDDKTCNTHTFIHETAHLFGIEDYYDADYSSGKTTGGFGGADLMDCTVGDHNAFTKLALGWIDKVILVSSSTAAEVVLPALQDAPALILLSDNFNKEKGLFQTSSYYILEYYTPTKLQQLDSIFQSNGVRMLRINAMLTNYTEDGYSYTYFRYNNSTTSLNMIDVIKKDGTEYPTRKQDSSTLLATNNDLFQKYDFSPLTIKNGLKVETFSYHFKISSSDDHSVTIQFSSL